MTDNILPFPRRSIEAPTLSSILPPSDKIKFRQISPVTPDDIQSAINYDFRGEWDRAVAKMPKMGLDPCVIHCHEVTIGEVGAGIAIAKYLSKDKEAVNALAGILCGMLKIEIDTIKLIEFEPEHRGYVWTLDYQTLVNASTFVRLRLERIIGRPIQRHMLFDF